MLIKQKPKFCMKIKIILLAIISIVGASCTKTEVGNFMSDNKVEIRANDTWLVAGRSLNGDILWDNQLNLIGSGTIFFVVTVNTGKNVPLDFSIEDPNKPGSDKTIIKTNPNPRFNWDPLTKRMDLYFTLNVSLMASGRYYIGHIVINGPSASFHQQTDYKVIR